MSNYPSGNASLFASAARQLPEPKDQVQCTDCGVVVDKDVAFKTYDFDHYDAPIFRCPRCADDEDGFTTFTVEVV